MPLVSRNPELRPAYDHLLAAIGVNQIGHYIGDISIGSKAIYIASGCSFFISYTLFL